MKLTLIFKLAIALTIIVNPVRAQKQDPQFDLSVDPIAFFLNGISVHGGFQKAGWHMDLEGFSLDVPAKIHGNDGFKASQKGLEIKMDCYFKGITDGFFVSGGGGISHLMVTHQETETSKDHLEYSAGLRAGYRWNTGLGNLYVTPLAGLEVTFNPRDFTMGGNTFESGPLQPYVTANIGWYF